MHINIFCEIAVFVYVTRYYHFVGRLMLQQEITETTSCCTLFSRHVSSCVSTCSAISMIMTSCGDSLGLNNYINNAGLSINEGALKYYVNSNACVITL